MATLTLFKAFDTTIRQIVFADHAGDFSPTAANDLRITTDGTKELDVQMAMVSVADSEYRQSDQFDFANGGTLWAMQYRPRLAVEMAATPTTSTVWSLYLAGSHHATAANANPGGVSGSDSDYTGYSSNADESIKQTDLISHFTSTVQVTTVVQIMVGEIFTPTYRYGTAILRDETGAAVHSDDVEFNLVFDPILPQFQA